MGRSARSALWHEHAKRFTSPPTPKPILVQHEDRMGHGPLNRMILQRIIEQGKTAKKLGYDPEYCAYTMVDLHALMEQHALENPYPS
mgnify:CR=1 FL=1